VQSDAMKIALSSVIIFLFMVACSSTLQTGEGATRLVPTRTTTFPFEITSTFPLVSTATLAPTFTPTLPAKAILTDFLAHKQLLSLDCESAAAVDWAEYLGVKINEYEFQHGLPISENPDYGFVGYSTGPWGQVPPYAYGVHAGPIADRLQQYGLKAVAVKGATLDQVKHELAAGRPVIAWVIGNCVGGVSFVYTDQQGRQVTVAAYEHVIILYGFDGDTLYYFSAGKRYMIPSKVFMNSWAVLGNMIVIQGD